MSTVGRKISCLTCFFNFKILSSHFILRAFLDAKSSWQNCYLEKKIRCTILRPYRIIKGHFFKRKMGTAIIVTFFLSHTFSFSHTHTHTLRHIHPYLDSHTFSHTHSHTFSDTPTKCKTVQIICARFSFQVVQNNNEDDTEGKISP